MTIERNLDIAAIRARWERYVAGISLEVELEDDLLSDIPDLLEEVERLRKALETIESWTRNPRERDYIRSMKGAMNK